MDNTVRASNATQAAVGVKINRMARVLLPPKVIERYQSMQFKNFAAALLLPIILPWRRLQQQAPSLFNGDLRVRCKNLDIERIRGKKRLDLSPISMRVEDS